MEESRNGLKKKCGVFVGRNTGLSKTVHEALSSYDIEEQRAGRTVGVFLIVTPQV